jgi:hypothetical protein
VKRLSAAVLAALTLLLASAAVAAAPKPAKLVLTRAQAGKGFFEAIVQGGQSLKQPTLDICHETLPSEKLRLARDKVAFQRNTADPAIVNEVVVYKPGGAAQALRDVVAAVKACPKGPVAVGTVSITTTITKLHAKGTFLPGSITLGYHAFGTVSGHTVSTYAAVVYERRGDVLSGVYAFGSTLAKRLTFVGRAATQSALNLKRG